MVRDEGAVAGQILHKELQLLQHLLLRERIDFSALCFLQKWRAGEQGQSAGPHKHRLALTEDLRRIDGMFAAVRLARNTV